MMPETSVESASITRPPPALTKGSSRYQVPKSFFEDHCHVDDHIRSVMMAQFLYRRFQEQGWLQQDPKADNHTPLGIVMRIEHGDDYQYIAQPRNVDDELKTITTILNVPVVFTMSSELSSLLFTRVNKDDTEITLAPNNITVPIIDSIRDLARIGVRRRDFCCFVREQKVVLVWSNSADEAMLRGADVESKFMSAIWGAPIIETPFTAYQSGSTSATPHSQQTPSIYSTSRMVTYNSEKGGHNLAIVDEGDLNAEAEESLEAPKRQFLLAHSFMIGLAMCLLMIIESLAVRLIVIEVHALGKIALLRLALLVTLPIFMFFTLFFTIVLVGVVFQVFGPMRNVKTGNSRFYSSQQPEIRQHSNIEFPHITIQMPVYKEGLKGVIIPTVNSLLAAIRNYESLGGTASIYVNEDGMQAVKPEVAEMRQRFYRANKIGWCSRPAHEKGVFERVGKFKKASNMNYCLSFSSRVEDELLRLLAKKSEREGKPQEEISLEEEEYLYHLALATILERDGGKTMAEGNIRLGDIILIADCDTRVPEDCLSLGAMEMEENPEVAIIQHSSGVMQVTHSAFENAISYFTHLVYLLIKFSVGSGDCAPFVGHNAFLRWQAIQSVSFMEGDVEKFWSEKHVSEDFDMSLRLQTAGFIVRLATYGQGEFKEGVSLTIFDELLRWEKYSYGCSELIFHPIHQWIYRGPFTALLLTFLGSNIKITAKFTILGYIGTYYAIGAALPLSVLNYFLTGWLAGELDHSYLPSWDMLCGTLVVFLIVSPLAFAWYRQRLREKTFFWAAIEALTWMPFFLIFFGGLSWHISYALLAHLFTLPIEWSSTAKELENGGFRIAAKRVWKTFGFTLIFMIFFTGGMIYLGLYAPPGWRITAWTSIVPVANQVVGHTLLPIFAMIF